MHLTNAAILAISAGMLASFSALPASADCQLRTVAELHVDVSGGRPVVDGAINGEPVKILIDSGATTSILVRPQAERLHLPMVQVTGAEIFGVGGQTPVYRTTVAWLKFGNFTATDLPLWVTGAESSAPRGVALMLGSDFLSQYDVEFDLGHGMVRLFDSHGCAPGQLVYWSAPYSMVPLLASRTVEVEVALNGKHVLAEVDSGASQSLVDTAAATSSGASGPQPSSPSRLPAGPGP
jgi:predicted aspartyl protease